ncbi:universal stress protein [Peterkaempfera griseoplana]|uniref:universal stress protein n=1 Tax=Peterkaempfera griseoplana TaxID=66896 RepID=UPI0006E16C75|nr:universal stress protein [Peterkaempfera griseoplana]
MNTYESGSRPPGRVVVGVDGSPAAGRALWWAAHEAVRQGRVLHIVHGAGVVYADYIVGEAVRLLTGAARVVLDEAAAEVGRRLPDLPVTTALSHGPGSEAVLEAARPDDLAVVGCRGRGGFSGLLLGSVSLSVAARASCPVVVVRGGPEPGAPAGEVVAGFRDEQDLPAVRFAARIARSHRADLRVVHAWRLLDQAAVAIPMFDEVAAIRETEGKAFTASVDALRREFPGLPTTDEFVEASSTAGALLHAAAGAGLLVVGTRRPHSRVGLRLGRVTHAVLHHADCPVAVVPGPAGADATQPYSPDQNQ